MALNRAARRAAARAARKAGDVVRLIGGPMDGWLVTPDAPALDPGWGEITTGILGSRYERAGRDRAGTSIARWREG